jgi:serine/threonine protein kinase
VTFQKGQNLDLPELASKLGLDDCQFAIQRVIRGGMGDCLRLFHCPSQRSYALKTVKSIALADPQAYVRFLQEIRFWFTASACDGVVEAYCVVHIDEIPGVCAAWMEGGDLRPRLEATPPAFFYATMDRILATLEWVYESHKIIHRDLKPENILFDMEGRAFICDWGIGKVQSTETGPLDQSGGSGSRIPSAYTQTGQFIGTVPYSAPEQLIGSRSIDRRADMYSLGCVMYEWETGQPPFLGETVEQIAFQHLQRPAPKLGGLFKWTIFGAEAVIAKCLAKKPEDRFESYAEFRRALRDCARARRISLISHEPQTR